MSVSIECGDHSLVHWLDYLFCAGMNRHNVYVAAEFLCGLLMFRALSMRRRILKLKFFSGNSASFLPKLQSDVITGDLDLHPSIWITVKVNSQ
jgi:hypothetical protein